jgi:hypothetical protein
VAFVVTLFIKELPLRQTAHVAAGRQVSGAQGQAQESPLG